MSRLLTIRTDLSDYKAPQYGYDRLGAGPRNTNASGQPYVLSSIPKRSFDDRDFGRSSSGFLEGEDFLLRGGSLTPNLIAEDLSRLSKMMFDLKSPNGILFSVKQNVLSRTAVNIKAGLNTNNKIALNNGVYLPTSTLLQAGVNPLGGHLLKQGINPFAETNVVSQGNSLSTGFGGAFPLSNPLYLDTDAQSERQNPTLPPTSRLIKFTNNKIDSDQGNQTLLYDYSGGPGSTLGVGKTNINLSRERTGLNNPQLAGSATQTNQFKGSLVASGSFDYSVFTKRNVSIQGSRIFSNSISKLYQQVTGVNLIQNQYSPNSTGENNSPLRNFATSVFQSGSFNSQNSSVVRGLETTLDYNQLQNAFQTTPSSLSGIITGSSSQNDGGGDNVYQRGQILQDYRQKTKTKGLPSLDYTDDKQRYTGRVNLGDPGRKNIPRTSYQSGIGEATDKINALPIYRGKNIDRDKPINDFVKFRIGVIDNDNPEFKTYIHFRALINQLSDSYEAEWQGTKFAGRGEQLFNYQGFDRTVSLGWTVAAQSKAEIMEQWKKLNYLASSLAPDYSADGYMRGNLVELTIGGWLYKQVGFIGGFALTLPEESPWEIAIPDSAGGPGLASDPTVKEMPMICNVEGFEFTPIHNFVPSIQKNNYGTDEIGNVVTYGPQRYISLSNGSRRMDNNYDRAEPLETIASSGISPIKSPLPTAPTAIPRPRPLATLPTGNDIFNSSDRLSAAIDRLNGTPV